MTWGTLHLTASQNAPVAANANPCRFATGILLSGGITRFARDSQRLAPVSKLPTKESQSVRSLRSKLKQAPFEAYLTASQNAPVAANANPCRFATGILLSGGITRFARDSQRLAPVSKLPTKESQSVWSLRSKLNQAPFEVYLTASQNAPVAANVNP